MTSYQLFGNRLVVRALEVAPVQVRPELDAEYNDPPRLVYSGPPRAMPARGFNPFAEVGGFGKGQVISIGAPIVEQRAPASDDVLSQSRIGDDDQDVGGPFSEKFMTQFIELMGRAMGSASKYGDIMPPLEVGNVIVFSWHDAALLPDETDLFVVPGRAVVGVVTVDDFKGGAGGVEKSR